MIRVGVVGTESSHVLAFVRLLTTERRVPGIHLTEALASGTPRDDELAASGLRLHGSVEDVVEASDAVIVAHRDARLHVAPARLALRRGRPTLVDKPLAPTMREAAGLLAEAHRAPLMSASALQFHPAVLAAANAGGGKRHVTVTGPAQPSCPHGGLLFYGIHAVEAACAVAGDFAVRGVRFSAEPDGARISWQHGSVEATVRLLDLPPGGAPFTVALDGSEPQELVLHEDYLWPVTQRFADMLTTGIAPSLDPTLTALQVFDSI